MNAIFSFLQKELKEPSLPADTFEALHRHFFFIQRLSVDRADRQDTYYYEREWRLGEQTLVPEEKLKRPNAKYWCQKEGYPPYPGKLVRDGDTPYFAFEPDDVAFLVCPRSWQPKIANPNGFQVEAFEDLVGTSKD